MKIVLVSKCSLDIEQNVEFKMSVLISPSKSLLSSCWVTYVYSQTIRVQKNMLQNDFLDLKHAEDISSIYLLYHIFESVSDLFVKEISKRIQPLPT